MAEQQPPKTEEKGAKRKCAQTGVPLKKTRQYYREGLYFINKNAFKAWKKVQEEKKPKEKPAAASAEPAGQKADPAAN